MEKNKLGPDQYRYVDEMDPQGLEVICKKYVVIGETEQCWYIVEEFHNSLFDGPHRESIAVPQVRAEGWRRARPAIRLHRQGSGAALVQSPVRHA
ncbi:hypothetical protein [Pseudomonas sp. SWRI81]|uniref:hypothetical protein n=1 Tax=Pseudomonas sp. SWRI81 TaxID=2745505 RepID=UPI001EE31187|nr:hypothetical protein [Pseudomonas sp. SWRI81]